MSTLVQTLEGWCCRLDRDEELYNFGKLAEVLEPLIPGGQLSRKGDLVGPFSRPIAWAINQTVHDLGNRLASGAKKEHALHPNTIEATFNKNLRKAPNEAKSSKGKRPTKGQRR